MAKSELLVGLDIGTTKVCVVVGELSPEGVDIVGIGTSPSNGMRKGVVVNIEQTVRSIKHALDEAELMAGCEIRSVYAGIAGSHIKGLNSHGVIAVKGGEVTARDMERVLDAAKAVAIPMDREVLHVIAQEYIVDDQRGIADPLGMAGVRLEVKVHIVTGAVTCAQNIVRACNRSGLDVQGIVLEPLASSKAILTGEEKELGVALVDIGGGTTDISVFSHDSIRYTGVLGVGGTNLTNDIAFGLRTPMVAAEKIKVRHSCALGSLVGDDEVIEVPGVGGREGRRVSRQVLTEICQPRMEEILDLIDQEILRSGLKKQIGAGVVLTGGASLIQGMQDLAESMLELPVRIGVPENVGGLRDVVDSPMYATAVGLLLHGAELIGQEANISAHEGSGFFARIFEAMRAWFSAAR